MDSALVTFIREISIGAYKPDETRKRALEILAAHGAREGEHPQPSVADGFVITHNNLVDSVHAILDHYPIDATGEFQKLAASKLALAIEKAMITAAAAAPQPQEKP